METILLQMEAFVFGPSTVDFYGLFRKLCCLSVQAPLDPQISILVKGSICPLQQPVYLCPLCPCWFLDNIREEIRRPSLALNCMFFIFLRHTWHSVHFIWTRLWAWTRAMAPLGRPPARFCYYNVILISDLDTAACCCLQPELAFLSQL